MSLLYIVWENNMNNTIRNFFWVPGLVTAVDREFIKFSSFNFYVEITHYLNFTFGIKFSYEMSAYQEINRSFNVDPTIYLFHYFSVCLGVWVILLTCIFLHYFSWELWRSEEGSRSFGIGIIDSLWVPYKCWALNPVLLQE